MLHTTQDCTYTVCAASPRTFYAEVSSGKLDTPLAIVESFCQALVRNQDSWNQYQTFLLNMEQGQRVLSQYGGTFFQVTLLQTLLIPVYVQCVTLPE